MQCHLVLSQLNRQHHAMSFLVRCLIGTYNFWIYPCVKANPTACEVVFHETTSFFHLPLSPPHHEKSYVTSHEMTYEASEV